MGSGNQEYEEHSLEKRMLNFHKELKMKIDPIVELVCTEFVQETEAAFLATMQTEEISQEL